jgi:hypothetical protein
MLLSSVRKEPSKAFVPKLTVAAPVTGTAAGGSVAVGGGAVVAAAWGLHAASSNINPASALKTRCVVFIFSPFEVSGSSMRSTLYDLQLDWINS